MFWKYFQTTTPDRWIRDAFKEQLQLVEQNYEQYRETYDRH